MAAGAETRSDDVAVPGQGETAGLPDAEQAGWVVERAEAVHAVGPGRVDVRVAALAVIVIVQELGGDEVPGQGAW